MIFSVEGWIFGHYDSRGGAALIIKDKLEDAMTVWNERFYWNKGLLGHNGEDNTEFLESELLYDHKVKVTFMEKPVEWNDGYDLEYGSLMPGAPELEAILKDEDYWGKFSEHLKKYSGRCFIFYSMSYNGGQVELFGYPMGNDDTVEEWPRELGPYNKEVFGEDAYGLILCL